METKPTAFHSLGEWVSESQISAEAVIHNPSVQYKKAPTAEPEEDINMVSPKIQMADMSERKDWEMQCLHLEIENMTVDSCEDEFPPPPSPFTDLSPEEAHEQDFSMKVIAVEWINNDIPDPINDPDSSQEWRNDVFNVDVDSQEAMEPKSFVGLTEISTNLRVSKPNSDNDSELTVHFPPFADESDGEDAVNLNSLKHLDNKSLSESSDSTLSVVDIVEQQGELFVQSELSPLGVNLEVTQQVLSQVSPPLSVVSIEPSNHAALSDGSVVVIGESRVGHAIEEGESRQISSEDRQFKLSYKEGQQQIRGVLRSVQEQRSEKCGRVSFQHGTMESDSCDESDSGVSADFSPCATLESSARSASAHTETPIEREIRRAIEREHSLRRSRGLPSPPTAPEYVEIPLRKAVFCQSFPPTKSDRCQGKDRQFAGKKMQQDIYEEAQREQDLVKLGKVPGFYDKGTVRQLKERKQLFEAFQKQNDSSSAGSIKCKTTSCSSDISILENDSLCDNSKVTRTGSDTKNELTSKTPKILSEAKGCHIIIIENHLDIPPKRPNNTKEAITVVDLSIVRSRKVEEKMNEDHVDLAPKENPFFKLRSSTSVVKVEQDIQEAQKRERELLKQRLSVYGTGVVRGGGKTAVLEEHSSTLALVNGLPVQDLHDSSQTGVTTTTAARCSSGKQVMWPPVPAEKNNQLEVPHCPRTSRQKTPLVQRWESGLINGHND